MTSKLFNLFYLFILFVACSDDKNIENIKQVDIIYSPSFHNRSVLHLDKEAGIGTFMVNNVITYSYGVPLQLSFFLKEAESQLSISRFWDEMFLKSLQRDETAIPNRDGMTTWIFYSNGEQKDSVNLGNIYTPRVDSIISEQLKYIDSITKDSAMKGYIRQVTEYL
ncbi:MAG: hypothetical protein EOP48_04940 [Sphingobacteriales bacterium]|nr:MAG: hypothetical protein EOP48_04940 [Sphingobacteriales bacterium]